MKMLRAFREAAKSRNLCEKYSEMWDCCNTKKQFFDLATDSNGIPYICEAMVDGWGVTPDFISENFKTFINGRYISQHNGYTSAMYVERFFIEPLVAKTTNVVIMACEGVVEIPENVVCNLFIVNSDVVVSGYGVCYVKAYGENTVKYDETVRHFDK